MPSFYIAKKALVVDWLKMLFLTRDHGFFDHLHSKLIITKLFSEKVNITDGGAEAKARIYYDACIDTNETIEKLGPKPLLGVIETLGGWHILPNTTTKPHKWNLQKLLQDVQNT